MILWGSAALAYNVQRSGFSCQQHTDPPTEYGWVPVYTDMPSLGKKGLPNDEAKLWPQGRSSVTGVYRTAECGHRNTYTGESHELGSSATTHRATEDGGQPGASVPAPVEDVTVNTMP